MMPALVPRDYPEFTRFLVEQDIDRIALNPDSIITATVAVLELERNRVG